MWGQNFSAKFHSNAYTDVSKNNQAYEILMRPQIGHFKAVSWRRFVDRWRWLFFYFAEDRICQIDGKGEEAGLSKGTRLGPEDMSSCFRVRWHSQEPCKKPHKGQPQWARALTSQFTLNKPRPYSPPPPPPPTSFSLSPLAPFHLPRLRFSLKIIRIPQIFNSFFQSTSSKNPQYVEDSYRCKFLYRIPEMCF